MRGALVLTIACTLVVGCTSDRPRPGETGDAGGSVDAGPSADAAATLDAGSTVPDSGAVDAGPTCVEELVLPITTRPCSAETKACTEACAEPTCVDSCLAASSSACRDCTNRAVIACFNRNGCQPQWNCYRACAREHCTGAPDVGACLDMHCVEPEQAYYDCIDLAFPDSPCPGRYVDCLPE